MHPIPGHTRPRPDDGAALPLVIALGMVIIIIATTTLTFAASGARKSRTDEDSDAALAAAYAGIEEYRSRLSSIHDAWLCINEAAEFTPDESPHVTGCGTNPALDTTAGGQWETLDERTAFRYEIDNSRYRASGALRIRATGRVGTVTRSVVAELRDDEFTRYAAMIMFTTQAADSSTNWGASDWGTPGWGTVQPPTDNHYARSCDRTSWNGRDTTRCGDTQWGAPGTILGNTLWEGPVHSNDTITGCDVRFTDTVSSSDPRTSSATTPQPCPDSDLGPAAARYKEPLSIPSTLGSLRDATASAADGEIAGCLYTGPTTISFSADGSMTVRSPRTRFTNVSGPDANSGTNPPECGTPGSAPGQLGSADGATVNVLEDGLLFIQDVPVDRPNVNAIDISDLTNDCFSDNGVGFPTIGETRPVSLLGGEYRTSSCPYGARSGDAFIQGAYSGSISIAAEGSAYVTGDLSNQRPTVDLLGLMAQRNVIIWNPIHWERSADCEANSGCGTATALAGGDRRVDASLLAATGAIVVQNAAAGGDQGTLLIHGSVASRQVGVTSAATTSGGGGYGTVRVAYNERLRTAGPPQFIRPESPVYTLAELVEVAPAYTSEGALQ